VVQLGWEEHRGTDLYLLFELVGGCVFALSSGLLFSNRFRQSYLAIAAASVIAITSSVFLLKDLVHQLTGTEKSAASSTVAVSWNSKGTDSFSAADLAELADMMQINACRMGCSDKKFQLFRLPLDHVAKERPIYRVTHIEQGYCGSGGCMSAVMVLDNGRLYIVKEDLGMDDRQAMLIAREASTQYPNKN
jgi:hypothetical protein